MHRDSSFCAKSFRYDIFTNGAPYVAADMRRFDLTNSLSNKNTASRDETVCQGLWYSSVVQSRLTHGLFYKNVATRGPMSERGARGAQFPGRRKVPTMLPRTFFNTVHLLPTDLWFQHGDAKLDFLSQGPSNLVTPLRGPLPINDA